MGLNVPFHLNANRRLWSSPTCPETNKQTNKQTLFKRVNLSKQRWPSGSLITWKFLRPRDKLSYCNCWRKIKLITGFSSFRQHCTFLCEFLSLCFRKVLVLGCLPVDCLCPWSSSLARFSSQGTKTRETSALTSCLSVFFFLAFPQLLLYSQPFPS